MYCVRFEGERERGIQWTKVSQKDIERFGVKERQREI